MKRIWIHSGTNWKSVLRYLNFAILPGALLLCFAGELKQ
jgi:hypothetical protein